MASDSVISFANWGLETTFGTVSTSLNKTFGQGTKVTTLTRRNNIEAVYGTGSRNAGKLVPKKYEGIFGVEFALSNPWFFRLVMGNVSSTGTDPTTHTFAETNTIPSFSVENEIATDTVTRASLLGLKVNSCVITAAVGEIVRVRLDMLFADEDQTSSTSSVVAPTFEVFTFAHGTFELPNGTTIAEVQSAEITITQNVEMRWGLGSRVGQNAPVKNRQYSGRATASFQDYTKFLQNVWGGTNGPVTSPAEVADMELTFTNSLTGANKRTITMTFTGLQFDEHSLPQDPTTVIVEDAAFIMRSLNVTADNSVTTFP